MTTLTNERQYLANSLKSNDGSISFKILPKNLAGKVEKLISIEINGEKIDESQVFVFLGTKGFQLAFPYFQQISYAHFFQYYWHIFIKREADLGDKMAICLTFENAEKDIFSLEIEENIFSKFDNVRIPKSNNNYSLESIAARQTFIEEKTQVKYEHINKFSIEPELTKGNCENFIGVAQVPIGIMGPILVNGEYAKGEFYVPLATTEGTLVASYHRGAKVLNLSGGVTTTISGDAMQRAPEFLFENARDARDFSIWVKENLPIIKQVAESSSSVAKLFHIDFYLFNRSLYMRFNYSTGDAAGQNMTGKATFFACEWIKHHYPKKTILHYYLESNFGSDKKASYVNLLHTRGKRVIAEATVDRYAMMQFLRATPEQFEAFFKQANLGAFITGTLNNAAHTSNALTAMFIATGQDVANISEAAAAVGFVEVNKNGDLYMSLTLPSLIVATHGGGTGLPTQRECLEIMGCYGKDKVNKLAEIMAAVVMGGELSLVSAIIAAEWVSSHESLGRNR